MNINIKLLHLNAIVPVRARKGDAGADLFALEDDYIMPGQRKLIKTGIAIAVPNGYYARIAPRSGLAFKKGIDVMAGVIDVGYRNEVGVVLINLSDAGEEGRFAIQKGDKIAQLIIERCYDVDWQVVDNLDDTYRGQGGFGSTDNPNMMAVGSVSTPFVGTLICKPPLNIHTDYPTAASIAITGDPRLLVELKTPPTDLSKSQSANSIRRAIESNDISKYITDDFNRPFNPLDHEQTK